MAAMFAIGAVFKGVDKTTKVTQKIGRSGAKSFKQIDKAVGKTNKKLDLFNSLGKKAVAATVALGAITMLVSGMREAVDIGIEFEKTLVVAGAKFGGIQKGTEDFAKLEEVAMRVGKTTEFSASQAAQGLQFLAAAGFNAEASIKALPTIVDFATAANLDLATATDIATDSLGAFGFANLEAAEKQKKLQEMMAIMAIGANKHNFAVDQFFETVKQSAPMMQDAGMSLRQYTAAVGVLADSGKKGGDAGTIMKNVLMRLQKVTPAAADKIKELGLNFTEVGKDGVERLREFPDIIDELNAKLPEGTKRMEAIGTIFGQIPMSGINILLKSGGDSLRAYSDRLDVTGKDLKELASIMRDNLKGQMDSLKSATEGLQLTFFKALAPALSLGVKLLTKMVSAVDWVLTKTKAINPFILNFGIALTVVTGIMVGIPAIITAVTAAWSLFSAALLINPFTPIIIGISLLIAGLIYMATHWDLVKMKAVEFFEKVKPWLKLWLIMMGPVGWIILKVARNFDKLKAIAMPVIKEIAGGISLFAKSMKFFIADLIVDFKEFGKSILNFIITPMIQMFDLLSKVPKIGPEFATLSNDLKNIQKDLALSPEVANQRATREEIVQTKRNESVLTINDTTGRASLSGDAPESSIKMRRTALAGA